MGAAASCFGSRHLFCLRLALLPLYCALASSVTFSASLTKGAGGKHGARLSVTLPCLVQLVWRRFCGRRRLCHLQSGVSFTISTPSSFPSQSCKYAIFNIATSSPLPSEPNNTGNTVPEPFFLTSRHHRHHRHHHHQHHQYQTLLIPSPPPPTPPHQPPPTVTILPNASIP